jgi:hypothetical protein
VADGGEIWLDGATQYKFVLKTSVDVLIATYDSVWGIGAAGGSAQPIIFNALGNGTTATFSLSATPVSENSTNVFISGVYQQKNTYVLSGASLIFSEAPPLNSTIEVSFT